MIYYVVMTRKTIMVESVKLPPGLFAAHPSLRREVPNRVTGGNPSLRPPAHAGGQF